MAIDKIAIVGSYGCGKTVLLTVLTHYFQHPTSEGYQIRPDNQEATNFCIRRWEELKGGEWPAPTPPAAKPPIYRWKLIYGTREKQMVTSDIAGEAWRSFITERVEEDSEKSVQSPWQSIKQQWKTIPSQLSQDAIDKHITSVENLLKSASGIFLLLDLSQIINKEQGYDLAMFLPTALVQYMKQIGRKHVPITLVLSKTDKYKYMYEELGDWQKVVESCLPWAPTFANIVPVSAVADTKIKTRANGEKESCPAPGFSSDGLKELYENIWQIMSEGGKKEFLHSLKLFCLIDVPILFVLWLIYLLLFVVASSPAICSVYFWLSLVAYVGIKVVLYMNKQR